MSTSRFSVTALRVREFHAGAGIAVRNAPTMLSTDELHARMHLIWEEYHEVEDAVRALTALRTREAPYPAPVLATVAFGQLARELADLVYVTYGAAIELGIDLDAVIAEVHRANMRKVGPGSRRGEGGKILKPAGWEPPDVERVIFGAS